MALILFLHVSLYNNNIVFIMIDKWPVPVLDNVIYWRTYLIDARPNGSDFVVSHLNSECIL